MAASGAHDLTSGGQTARETYQYTPIQRAGSTRVFTLSSDISSPEQLITVTTHEISLAVNSQQPDLPYTAVSYAWEGQIRTHEVICDGKSLKVTLTVLQYLEHERQKLKSAGKSNSHFWIDTICIDQEETPTALVERASQVQLMQTIFSRAEKVDVWLGPKSDVDEYIAAFIPTYCAIKQDEFLELNLATQPEPLLEALGLPDMHSDFWEKFSAFINRPWFFRIWVIQEFAVAKIVCFRFGEREISHLDLTAFLQRVLWHIAWFGRKYETVRNVRPLKAAKSISPDHFEDLTTLISRGTSGIASVSAAGSKSMAILAFQTIAEKRTVYQQSLVSKTGTEDDNDRTFCRHFFDTLHFKSTNPRDRVYALLGFSQDQKASELAVNYLEHEDLVAERVTEYMFKKGFGVACLLRYSQATWKEHCGWRLRLEAEDVYQKDPLALHVAEDGSCKLFSAAAGSTLDASFFSSSDGRKRLAIKGRLIGQVCEKHIPFFSIDSEVAESLVRHSDKSLVASEASPSQPSSTFQVDQEEKEEMIEILSTIMSESEARCRTESYYRAVEEAMASLKSIFDPTGQVQAQFKHQLDSFCAVSEYINKRKKSMKESRMVEDCDSFELLCWNTIANDISFKDPSRLMMIPLDDEDDEEGDISCMRSICGASRALAEENPSVYASWTSSSIASSKVREKHPDLIKALVVWGNMLKQAGGKVLALMDTRKTDILFPCLLPPNCENGDILCIFYGCALPVLLRPLPKKEYLYLGPCYATALREEIAMKWYFEKEEQVFVVLPGDKDS